MVGYFIFQLIVGVVVGIVMLLHCMLLYLSGIGGMDKPSYVGFKSKEYHWKPDIDYRENPHLYKVGRGQQGVLICQPYKSELHTLEI